MVSKTSHRRKMPNVSLLNLISTSFYQYFSFSNKDQITADRLSEADLVVFGGPRDLFSVADFKEIKSWLSSGGRALFMLSDGGEKASGCNINYLLEE